MGGTPKSSTLIGFFTLNHLFRATPISGNPHIIHIASYGSIWRFPARHGGTQKMAGFYISNF